MNPHLNWPPECLSFFSVYILYFQSVLQANWFDLIEQQTVSYLGPGALLGT